MGGSSSTVRVPDLVAAEIAEINARAAESQARAEATKVQAAATKLQAEAQFTESQARMHAMKVQSFTALVPIVGCAAVAVALAADFYLHESPTYIKRRMMRTLRACRLPPSVDAMTSTRLHVPQAPLTLGFLPTLLLGPTGCGKSTLLADIARMAVSTPVPAPTVFVRMRQPSSRRGYAGADQSPVNGEALMDATAAQIFAQIGYPLRRSIVGGMLSRGIMFQGQRTQTDLVNPESRNRLVAALNALFEVCAELQAERISQGMTRFDAAPVLLFDELQDLIKDARLKNAGGDLVFATLATLLISYGVDRSAVRIVVAGSSAEVYFSFSEVSPARGARFRYFDLKDPSPDSMIGALQERGYTLDEARTMVALCGTRLRLFDRPLSMNAATASAATFIEESTALATADFAEVFAKIDKRNTAELVKLLDAITEIDTHDSANVQRPSKKSLPLFLQRMDLAPIIYVNRARELHFQSHLHFRTWPVVRSKYAVKFS